MADRVSPLSALAKPGEFGALNTPARVQLSEYLSTALVQVACFPDRENECRDALTEFLGSDLRQGKAVSRGNDCAAMPTGFGRWLIDGDDDQLETKLRKILPAEVASITALTHGRVQVNVEGEKAAWLLATGIALDFDLSVFPAGTSEVSHHHEIGLTIHRVAEDKFELYLFTSFARGFWHWITKAAAEVGYRVV